MRRIVINRTPDKKRLKCGCDLHGVGLDHLEFGRNSDDEDLVALDDALAAVESEDAIAAHVVKLQLFAGIKQREMATALGISLRSAELGAKCLLTEDQSP
jgi:hypothetical protein